MWFKQIQLFQLTGQLPQKTDVLEEKLNNFEFQPCLATQSSGHGWIAPLDVAGAPLLHAANGFLLVCLQVEEKLLPAAVVKHALDEKVRLLEASEQRLTRQAKADLKQDITATLLPKAFSKYTRVYAYIDPKLDLLVLNTANKRHTELFLDAVQKTLPLVKLVRPDIKRLSGVMTQWLANETIPEGFYLEKSCTLQDREYQARVIRCTEQELSAKPIMTLLKEGCEVKQIALLWQERIKFSLGDDFVMRNVKFSEQLLESAKSMADDPLQQFDADFALMTESLHEFLQQLLPLVLKSSTE